MPNRAIAQLETAMMIMPTITERWPPDTTDKIWPPTTLFTMLYPILVKRFRIMQTLLG